MRDRRRDLLTGVVAASVFGAACFEGSTHHLASQGLRAVLLLWIVATPRHRAPPALATYSTALALAGLATGLLASERLTSGLDFVSHAIFAAAVLLVAAGAERDWLRATADGLCLAASAQAIWALGEWVVVGGRASAGFFNPNYLGAWLALLAAWSVHQAGWRRTLVAPVLTLGVVATGSRSALLAVLLAMAALSWMRFGRRTRGLALGGLGIAAVLVVIFGREVGGADAYAFDRLQIWQSAWRAGWVEPWGWGLGDAPHAFRSVGVPLQHGLVQYPKVARHAHSELLQLWVELGWISAWVLGAILVTLSTTVVSARSITLLAAAAAPLLLGGPFDVPVYAATLALLIGAELDGADPAPVAVSRLIAPVAAFALALSTAGSTSRLLQEHAADARDRGELDAALDRAGWATRLAPYDLGAALMHGSLRFRRTRDVREALATLFTLSERFPSDPAPPHRAELLLRTLPATTERDEALATVQRERVRRSPRDATLRVALALTLSRLGENEESEKELRRALSDEPNCAAALAALALRSSNDDEAQRLAARALRADRASRHHSGGARDVLALPPALAQALRARVRDPIDIPDSKPRVLPL